MSLMSERLRIPLFQFNGPAIGWVVFFALIAASWAVLYVMAASVNAPAGSLTWTPDALLALCRAGADPSVSGWFAGFAMWAVMSLAMMAPTIVPLLLAWQQVASARPDQISSNDFAALVAGYLIVWLGFAALAASLQIAIADAGLLAADLRLNEPGISVAVLAAAGAYQFSRMKDGCLAKCRAPMAYLTANWRPGPQAAMSIGLRHGLDCLGCCWALMLLAFVAGTMNLVWMGLVTTLMIIEKLPDVGRYVTRPLGAVLLASAAAIALDLL